MTITQADIDRARAEGFEAATARIAGILDHPDAAGREQLARHLAFKTSVSVEQATAMFAVAPKLEVATETPAPVIGQRAGDTSLGLVLIDFEAERAKTGWPEALAKANAKRDAKRTTDTPPDVA
ncbi:hypothetical protein [Rhodoplanes azumiensis]|uniref:Uncharacterized protein n=1 Tax=Rhodoplanes azumiensis TaxID=1897628 RepID=A0ABW5AK37_9BRAD